MTLTVAYGVGAGTVVSGRAKGFRGKSGRGGGRSQAGEPHDSLTRGRVAFRLRSVMTIIPDKSPVARRRDGASAALRGVGLRLTGPRRLVLEVVRGSDAHPTAE